MVDKEQLKNQIREAFSKTPRPRPEALISHDCWQCNKLKDNFQRFANNEVPTEILLYHCDDLPLFSASGLRYFLPAYLLTGINIENMSLRENVIFHLAQSNPSSEYARDRVAVFSSYEKKAICSYLSYMAQQNWSHLYTEYFDKALKIWCDEDASM